MLFSQLKELVGGMLFLSILNENTTWVPKMCEDPSKPGENGVSNDVQPTDFSKASLSISDAALSLRPFAIVSSTGPSSRP